MRATPLRALLLAVGAAVALSSCGSIALESASGSGGFRVEVQDPTGRVAEARFVEEPDPEVVAEDPVLVAAPSNWDDRLVYTGGGCQEGAVLKVSEDGRIWAHDLSDGRSCGDDAAAHAVDIRWVNGERPDNLRVDGPILEDDSS